MTVTKIKRILSNTSTSLDRLKGDILRVLGLSMGRLWLSELKPELETFRVSLGLVEPVEAEELRKAITELVNDEVLEAEERIKATLAGGEKDLLIGVKDVNSLILAVKDDEAYRRYREMLYGSVEKGQ